MKKIYLLLLLNCFVSNYSQSVCEPNEISTDALSPVNPNQPDYINQFDWTTDNSYYNINSQCTPNTFTPNPFQSNQLELLPLSLSKDMMPEDGWEMIAYNLGYDNNNIPLAAKPEHTYIMLYNKYTGMLRILVKWCRNTNYNGALLTLKFAPGFQTNLLDMANDEKALDATHIANPSLSTTLKFYNDNNYWAYADFKLNYDPCTCSFDETSRLFLYTELISNSSVELTGKITGIISSITQGQGSTSSDGNFWKSATNINNKMMSAHKSVTNFADKYQKIYKDLADGGITIGAINNIGSFLNNNNFMKAGLKALPYVSEGVKFLSGLFGGGASGNQPIQLAPMSVNLDVQISGTISTQDPMHNQTIGLPGSINNNILPGTIGGQPLYNETLGVFSLINTPVMHYKESFTSKSFLNRETIVPSSRIKEYWEVLSDYKFTNRIYKLSGENLKYAINPASNLILQDAEIILLVEYEKPSITYPKKYPTFIFNSLDNDLNNGLAILGTNTGPSTDSDNGIFQNAFKPIGINNFKNDYSFEFLYDVSRTSNEVKTRQISQYKPVGSFTKKWQCTNSTNCEFQKIQGSRIYSYVQSKADLPITWSNLLTSDFKSNINNSLSFLPQVTTPRPEFLAPRVKNFKLKFVLNLKRTDNPNAQNVLYVVTYPVELKEAPSGYNMNGSDYIADAIQYAHQPDFNPTNPTNKVIPVTQSELATICSSTTYKANRISSASRKRESDFKTNIEKTNNENLEPKIFPVPVKDKLNVITNNCKIISIINSFGQIVKEFSENTSNDNEITIDTSHLSKGIYIMNYLDSNSDLKTIKFIIQ
ncbi:T9SS type A sorting domain-containing protein [Flavobacterium jejuense]|uniref:T9SS type A sorting domain-containing protein n=1 Tax=Flavobacterium jejuense TaxID=1544455 RepID=A0ABX0IN41_9FLAO|nr:T9SS type A sorting domain-containing protein [Flavobacterium jejuense]NHN25217.1 T9SS type A sorting domain-containing protein [Flavobacterium jejuense]